MQASTLDVFSRRTASALITIYQKRLSPHKGFSCAYRVLHQRESCSQYIKRAILEQGLGRAMPLIRQRFQDCKAANEVLRTRRKMGAAAKQNKLQPSLNHLSSFFSLKPTTPKLWLAIEAGDADLDGRSESSDAGAENSNESPNPRDRPGRGSFGRPPNAQTGANSGNGGGGNDLQGACDSIDCGCQAIDCTSMACDSFSGLDCSFLDCSSLDCGSLDCGGDFGSCG